MTEYILLMHDDVISEPTASWDPYIASLKQTGTFQGGSEIGQGLCVRKVGVTSTVTSHLTGFIRVTADSIDHAISLLRGNPHYEAGGTVEVRELPKS